MYVAQQRKLRNFTHIYAMDETAVWLDASPATSIARQGAKEVCVLTTGHEKSRITVVLTARSNGFKMKPFVLLPRKRPVPIIVEQFGSKLNLVWAGAGNSWMNDHFTELYLGATFGAHNFSQARKLLVWDSFRCHLSAATKAVMRKIGIESATVPGGCTKFIQAPDVSWNAPFKAHIRRSYDAWMAGDAREVTAGGNPKAPDMQVYLKWVVNAWNSLPPELIEQSFKTCGLTNALDGSEDDQIHCFKPTGPVPEELEMLKQKRQEAAADDLAQLVEEIDLEQDEENGYESDNSVEM
ncbi:pogo transposable element with KRAB domain-like protein [Aphelenchoides avenae]|nr:pogo transposable element with KRAB domain-like protein [Aphelenchus avenae]